MGSRGPLPIIGEVIGERTVVDVPPAPSRAEQKIVLLCSCGSRATVGWSHLRSTGSATCRDWRAHPERHSNRGSMGESKTNLFVRWRHLNNRCYDPADKRWSDYGGRGIAVCAAWRADFRAFRDWAVLNGFSEELLLDRIDNDGPYDPSNCRWVTTMQSARNTRRNRHLTAFGETKLVVEWSEDPRCRVYHALLRDRLHSGWDPERAIDTPAGPNGGGRRKVSA